MAQFFGGWKRWSHCDSLSRSREFVGMKERVQLATRNGNGNKKLNVHQKKTGKRVGGG